MSLRAILLTDNGQLGITPTFSISHIGGHFVNNLLFQSGDKVLFIGDSITDCGRRDAHAPLGHGYVRKITELITAKYPERDITYVNKGIGGDIVEGLENRWDTDVIAEKPKWLSVKIGINNASRQHGEGVSYGRISAEFGKRAIDGFSRRAKSRIRCVPFSI